MIENLIDRRMNNAQFGVTFFTSSQRQDTCGTNGLPLTPNSIRILGRSQYLKSLSHSNLSQYVDIIRGKHERIILVLEFYSTNLRKLLKEKDDRLIGHPDKILQFAKDVLTGLCYLNQHGIANRNLCLDNILFDGNNQVKLFNYGLYYMTNNGKYVSFPIGHPKYTAPEVVLSGVCKGPAIYSFDVWSLGIILVELILEEEIWSELKLSQTIRKVASLTHCESGNGGGVLQRLLQEHHRLHILKDLNPKLKLLVEKCLEINAAKRSCPKDLLQEIFDLNSESNLSQTVIISEDLLETQHKVPAKLSKFFRSSVLTANFTKTLNGETLHTTLDITQDNDKTKESLEEETKKSQETATNNDQNGNDSGASGGNGESISSPFLERDHLSQRSLKEVYYLWQLAGGDVFAELKRQGLTRKKPAILSLPCSMTLEGESAGKSKERGLLLDQTVIVLPLSELRKRLNDIPPEEYYPLIETKMDNLRPNVVTESALLPLIIREKDIEYQFHRILLFDRLIKGYPYTKSIVHRESLLDIPPFFRAQIWSCLLEIEGDCESVYNSIDKETPTSTDRQIEVDIPRCHQYDELLSSSAGHEKFKRVLKAWVVSNTKYVYWQGLDSLCAPFLYLNFNDEAMAFSCLSAFIPKYLYNFFLKDNSMIIQEYLAKFSQLIAFHDPQLTNHLDSIGFIPELYAIPWFLTMFSHVFPLHKIFHLWDKLLLGDSSFSLCIGLAILYQLRDSLLTSGFNECILLFSDMPEINIERCVKDSVEIYCSTPKSTLCRKHEPPSQPKRSVNSSRSTSVSSYDDCMGNNSRSSFSSDTRNSTNDALKMEAISLDDLKKEKCPRISGEDFLYLLDLNKTKFNKPKLLVVDVRNHEDYNRGAIPTSINMPYTSSFTPEGALIQSPEANVLRANRGKIIVVVGNRGDSAVKFAEAILRLEYPRVCVLHRGIDIFRSCNLLLIPSAL